VTLGKRKRRAEPRDVDDQDNSGDEEDLRSRFQKAFEAKFRPLDKTKSSAPAKPEIPEASDSASSDEDGWSGLSEDNETIEIVSHSAVNDADHEAQRREMKAYMVNNSSFIY